MKKMKTLTLQGNTFEVVDEQARNDIEALAKNTASVQPDFAQNNPEAADYIKNRPFYSEGVETITETRETHDQTSAGSYVVDEEFAKLLLEHKESVVCVSKISGITYTYAGSEEREDSYRISLNNNSPGILVIYKSEPDTIRWTDGGGYGGDEGSITITYEKETIHKLDKKYLPDNIGGCVLYASFGNLWRDADCTVGVTRDELLAMRGAYVGIQDETGNYYTCLRISDYETYAKAYLESDYSVATIEYRPK